MSEIPEDIQRIVGDMLGPCDDRMNRAAYSALSLGVARAILAERLAERERCAQLCEAQKQEFLSPQYASNQPFGSITERFACDECASSIRQSHHLAD